MGTVLFLMIRPLGTAPSVTPTPPVFSRFGPLGAFTVVRFPPPPFFNFRPRRLLELSVSNKSCPYSFLPFLYIHTHSEDRLPPFWLDFVLLTSIETNISWVVDSHPIAIRFLYRPARHLLRGLSM